VRHVLILILALVSSVFAVSGHATDIAGAGSTFAMPIYTSWANAYQRAGGGKVNYQGVGSTDGVRQIVASQVDFAGSDAPLSDADLAKNGLFQFPTVIGGVVPVVNLPGIKSGELTLTGKVLGDIFLGKIIYWDDPAIAAINPKLKMPDTPIAVVRRLDGSGTTLIWTHFLAQVNPEWNKKVGEGTSVLCPEQSATSHGTSRNGIACPMSGWRMLLAPLSNPVHKHSRRLPAAPTGRNRSSPF
jgi:phosphate transport system substrate-binding protein